MPRRACWAAVVSAALHACAHVPSAKDHEQAKIHYDIAVAQMRKGDMRAALRELLSSNELDASIPQAQNALGLVYHALGRRDDALLHYKNAVTLQPDFSDAHNNYAILLIDLGRHEEAIAHLQIAMGDILYPTPYLAEGNLGWAYFRKGDRESAIKHLTNAVATNPKFCRGYEWLTRIGLDTDDPTLAADNCRRFERQCLDDEVIDKQLSDPYRHEMAYYCGLSYLKHGDRDAARTNFEGCADIDGDPFARRCHEALKGL